MTVRDLARETALPHPRIEDLEAGLETWLSSPERQRIAKALGVEPVILQEVEYKPLHYSLPELQEVSGDVYEELSNKILSGETNLRCPKCGNQLKTSLKEGIDLENMPVRFASAHCVKCPFII